MLIRRLARPLLAAVFVSGGVNALRHPGAHAEMADPVAPTIARELPVDVTEDPETLVRIDAAVKIVAGLLLATNRLPRLSAIALSASLVPTTIAGHPFWREEDPQAREQQQIHFLKNLGLLGGLVLAAVDTEGRPSMAWWARRGADTAARSLSDTVDSARERLPLG